MNKREAKRRAWRTVYETVEMARRNGGMLLDTMTDDETPPDDVARLADALDEVCQDIYERAYPAR